jgi:hypothetical protein
MSALTSRRLPRPGRKPTVDRHLSVSRRRSVYQNPRLLKCPRGAVRRRWLRIRRPQGELHDISIDGGLIKGVGGWLDAARGDPRPSVTLESRRLQHDLERADTAVWSRLKNLSTSTLVGPRPPNDRKRQWL